MRRTKYLVIDKSTMIGILRTIQENCFNTEEEALDRFRLFQQEKEKFLKTKDHWRERTEIDCMKYHIYKLEGLV